MGIETFVGTYIDGLNPNWPLGSDGVNTADDHDRGIKLVLQNTFPNISGAVTATHTELNKLDGFNGGTADLNVVSGVSAAGLTNVELLSLNGISSNVQTQLNAKADNGANTGITSLGGITDQNTTQESIGIYHGRVVLDGVSQRLPSGWSVAKIGTGSYRVTHSLSNANYTVVATSFNTTNVCKCPNNGANAFDVSTYNVATGVQNNGSFQFHMTMD